MVDINVHELRTHDLNTKFFDDLSGEDYDNLKKSIEQHGILNDLLVTQDNVILGGHQRFKIAKDLGFDSVPCKVRVVKDDLEARFILITDNKDRRQLNTFQKAKLSLELRSIEEEKAKLRKLSSLKQNLPVVEYDDESSDDSTVPANLPERVKGEARDISAREMGIGARTQDKTKKIVESGDEEIEEMCNKGLSVDAGLKLVKLKEENREVFEKAKELVKEGKKVNTAIQESVRIQKKTELQKESFSKGKLVDENDNSRIIHGDCLVELGKLEDGSVSCLVTDPPYGYDYVSNRAVKNAQVEIANDKGDVTWDMLDKCFELCDKKLVSDSHIYVFCSWKTYPEFRNVLSKYWDVKNLIVWDKMNHSMGDLHGNWAERYELVIFCKKGNRQLLSDSRPVNIINVPRVPTKDHPTEKPVDLIKQLLMVSTVEGEVVLDPFAGVGSTVVAAKELKRSGIGIELESKYVKVAKDKL